LTIIGFEKFSAEIFLSLCKYFKKENKLLKWALTQPYIPKMNHDCDESEFCSSDEKENLYGLEYTGNSCYQDSVMMALFAIPNKIISKTILNPSRNLTCQKIPEIREELNNIAKSLRGKREITTCSNLRNLLRDCPTKISNFSGTDTQDAGEFLRYLFELFQVDIMKISRTTYATNDIAFHPETVIKVSEIISLVPPIVLVQLPIKAPIQLESFLNQKEDSYLTRENLYKYKDTNGKIEFFRRRIEINKVLQTKYMVFDVHRNFYDEKFDKTKRDFSEIIPPDTINVGKSLMSLNSIVVHTNNHYTCYLLKGKVWYYYDDIPNTITEIGTLDEMLSQETFPNPKTHGTLYFYV